MNICVCGWYFRNEFYVALANAGDYNITIICNREPPIDTLPDLNFITRPNVGLEFGAYQYYLTHFWEKGDTLFIHDDIDIIGDGFWNRVEQLRLDQAFLFQTEFQGKCNQNFHGRAFFCSQRFLTVMRDYGCNCKQAVDHIDMHHNRYCSEKCAREKQFTGWDKNQVCEFVKDKSNRAYVCPNCRGHFHGDFWGMGLRGTGPHNGFWYDPWNCGHNAGKPPVGVRHYNDEIYHFAMFCSHARAPGINGVRYDSRNIAIFPELFIGKRGKL